MKLAADTSVLVAGFASWHEHHAIAVKAIRRIDVVVGHCLLETFSVLTRMPAPHRIAPDVVRAFVETTLADVDVVALPAERQRTLVSDCAELGISSGAIYDALIGSSCAHAGLKLLTFDRRARLTYAALGVAHEQLA